MRKSVAVVYNELQPSHYDSAGESKAVLGVLESVTAVAGALRELGYAVDLVPLAPPQEQLEWRLGGLEADAVFNLFEGFCGQPETEALAPEILSELGMPFTGCPASTLRLALDKARAKVLLKAAEIPTPDFQLLNPQTLHMFQLGYPCIVKPRSEDASHGVSGSSVVNGFAALQEQVRHISENYGGALVEEFVAGREFNATVLGNTILPPSEIAYTLPAGIPRILTFAAKWEPNSRDYRETQVICPAPVDEAMRENIRATALAAFQLLGCRGYARVDMRLDGRGRLNVIEVNPNPDISPGAGAARQARAAGLSYSQFIGEIMKLALSGKENAPEHSPHVGRRQTGLDANTAQYAGVQTV